MANQNELKVKAAATENGDVLQRLGELINKLDSFTTRALKLKKLVTSPIRYLLGKIADPETTENECGGVGA